MQCRDCINESEQGTITIKILLHFVWFILNYMYRKTQMQKKWEKAANNIIKRFVSFMVSTCNEVWQIDKFQANVDEHNFTYFNIIFSTNRKNFLRSKDICLIA